MLLPLSYSNRTLWALDMLVESAWDVLLMLVSGQYLPRKKQQAEQLGRTLAVSLVIRGTCQ